MFTGIIKGVGQVNVIDRHQETARLTIATPLIDEWHSQVGDSIAVDGICLTITTLTSGTFTVDVMPETVRRTAMDHLAVGQRVNLEPALSVTDRLDGHFVLGHVDTTATLIKRITDQNAVTLTFSLPEKDARYVIEKGSVAVDGVSLTVTAATTTTFSVSLIPHTLKLTVLGQLEPGAVVNIETDILGKYVLSAKEERA